MSKPQFLNLRLMPHLVEGGHIFHWAFLGLVGADILRWEHFKYFSTKKDITFLKSVSETTQQNHKCTSFQNKIHVEYRQNYLRFMYISFASGLIANVKEGNCLVEYRLNCLNDYTIV